MPQDLAALLVEEGAVSQADMERAVTRQAQEGGALDTALLELELVGEGHLRSFLAHVSGLPPVPPGALSEIDPRARRVFPARVAERHRLAPFALDGRELSVVAVHPVDATAIDEIGFMLSLTLVPHVGPEWRVLDLIHRLYGGQMPARLARLAEHERQHGAGAPPPPPAAPPEPPTPAPEPPAVTDAAREAATATATAASAPSQSLEDAFFAAGETGAYAAPASAQGSPPHPALSPGGGEGVPLEQPALASTAPAPEHPAPLAAADEASFAGLDDSDTAIVAPAPLAPEAEAAPEEPQADEPAGEPTAARPAENSFAEIEPFRRAPSGFARDETEPAEPLLAALELAVDAYDALWAGATPEPAAQSPAADAPAAPAAEETAATEAGDAAAEGAAAEETPEPELPPAKLDRTAPPGWSIEDALGALSTAVHRDEVVLTALRFARDFFEFSALFAVTRDAVVGHDALGSQDDPRPHARGTAIYAEDPGIVRTVLETRAPYLGPVVRDAAGTTNILDGLWRGTPRTVLLYPILVGERPVAVLYADNGEAPVSARRLSDLLLFLSTVGGTFERIIRARKKRRPRGPAAQAPPPAPTATTEDATASDPAPSWMAPPPDPELPPAERPSAEPPAVEPPPAEVPIPEAANEPATEAAPDPAAEASPAEEASSTGSPTDPVSAATNEPTSESTNDPATGPASEPEPPPHPALSPGGGEGIDQGSEAPSAALTEGEGVDRKAGADDGRLEAAIALLLAGGQGPPDRVAPIVDLLLDPAPEVSAAAREALAEHRAHPGVRPVPERLRRGLLSGIGERPVLAALALGALRDVESIPILIQAFEGGSPEGARAASEALTRITLQRLGPSPQKWLRWWKENRSHSRAEWLFAALTSEEADLRGAAADELRAAGAPPVHYTADLPTSELAAAARAWWTWWSHQGLKI